MSFHAMMVVSVSLVALSAAQLGCATGRDCGCPGYDDAVRAFRQERVARLLEPRGWLALSGLFWLEKGVNTLGAGQGNSVVMPPSAPEKLGTLNLDASGYHLKVEPGVVALCKGAPVGEMTLRSDADPSGPPDVVEVGPVAFAVIVRGGDPALRVWDANSPNRARFAGIPTWPIDPAWRAVGKWVKYAEPRKVEVSTAIAKTEEATVAGEVRVTVQGQDLVLVPFLEEGSDELFLVFSDATTGKESYGGGRFLSMPLPDGNGDVVVDFNKAVNPPCMFTQYATCPRPRAENRVPLAVEAGEKALPE